MAEGGGGGGGPDLGAFKQKVGPLPLYLWIGAGLLLWWYVRRNQAASTAAGANGSQTDPAGNTGTIDPSTGYVYGTPEDTAALANQDTGSSGTGSSGTSGSTTGGTYATNSAWEEAAINYLVGIGVDPTEANAAIAQYLSSQQLTTQQQADVNEAIQQLGAPPQPPNPQNPTQIVSPPSPGPTYATNPPTGLTASNVGSTSASLQWNSASGATGYQVIYQAGTGTPQTTTVSGNQTSVTLSGLQPSTMYSVQVQAQPARAGDGYASTSVSTTAAQSTSPPPSPSPTPPPSSPSTTTVTVVPFTEPNPPWNSTLSGIAAHYNTSVSKLQSLNPSITNVNLIYPGQQITVPV